MGIAPIATMSRRCSRGTPSIFSTAGAFRAFLRPEIVSASSEAGTVTRWLRNPASRAAVAMPFRCMSLRIVEAALPDTRDAVLTVTTPGERITWPSTSVPGSMGTVRLAKSLTRLRIRSKAGSSTVF